MVTQGTRNMANVQSLAKCRSEQPLWPMGKEHSKSAEASYVTRHRAMGRCVSCVGHIKIANQPNKQRNSVGGNAVWLESSARAGGVGRHVVTGWGRQYMMPQVMVQQRYLTVDGTRTDSVWSNRYRCIHGRRFMGQVCQCAWLHDGCLVGRQTAHPIHSNAVASWECNG